MTTKLSGFRQLQQLGEGASGKVYLSVLTEPKPYAGLGDLVAIKTYKDEFLSEPKQLKRIEIEAQVGTGLSHPNVVRIFEGSFDPNEPFIVMEYVDGTTLNDWIKMFYPIPDEWVFTLFSQIVDGLAQLHDKDITHRDIKPENIMLTPDFNAKIMDLGVIQLPNKPGISPPGKLLGTIRNSSPDILKGQDYTEVDDIYSLGTVAYMFLHGEQIFADENNEASLIQKIINGEIYYTDESIKNRGKFSAEFLKLAKRLLTKDRKSRPQDISQVKEDLEKLQDTLIAPRSKPMHGYIASSLTGLQQGERHEVAFACYMIAEICKSYNIYAHQPRKVTDPILFEGIEPQKVYYLDRKRVLDADLLIVLANYPSFGGGQEIEIASSFGTPTILVVKNTVTVSRMVKGGFLNLLDDITYASPEELVRKLNKSLANNLEAIKSAKDAKSIHDVPLVTGKLAECRESLGYTIPDVAQRIGISPHMLEAIENYPLRYHNSSYYILAKICNFYGINLTDLTVGTQAIPKPILDDSNIKRLEDVAIELGWPASDYLELRQQYITEGAARNKPIITKQDWNERHNLYQKKKLSDKSAQLKLPGVK